MSAVTDRDEYGQIVRDEHKRLGAGSVDEADVGLYVRFEPGFGLNVHIGMRRRITKPGLSRVEDDERMVLGIDGWRALCDLVDEWRAREELSASGRGSES